MNKETKKDLIVMPILITAGILCIYFFISKINKGITPVSHPRLTLVTNPGFIFLCTFILISALVFAGSNEIRNKLIKPSKYLFPIFIALSFSFGVVSLIFGIHSDIFTAYDQNETGEFEFKWFKPAEIVNFPVSQLQLADQPEVNPIGLKESRIRNEQTCHLIFVDKTLSVRSNDTSINNDINKKITNYFSADSLNKIKNTADLLPIYIISELHKINTGGIDANDSYGVFYYDGISNKCKNFFNSTSYVFKTSELTNSRSNLINEYAVKNNQINRDCQANATQQKTKINEFLQYIYDILLVNQIRKPAFDNVCIYLLSDFIDDSNTSVDLKAYAENIRNSHTIKAIKLYHLQGRGNNNANAQNSNALVDQLKNEFKEFNPYKAIDLRSRREIQDLLKDLKVANFEVVSNNKDKLKFYYPYNEYGSNRACKASIKFIDNLTEDNYNFQLVDIDNTELKNSFIYQVNSGTEFTGQLNTMYTILLKKGDELKISLKNISQINSDRLGVNISSDKLSLEQFRFIELLPKMPETTCYYLVMFYSIFLTAVGLLLFFPNLFIYLMLIRAPHTLKKKTKRRISFVAMAWGLVPIIFLFYQFHNNSTLLGIYIFILLVMLCLSIPAFKYYLKEEGASAKEKEVFAIYPGGKSYTVPAAGQQNGHEEQRHNELKHF